MRLSAEGVPTRLPYNIMNTLLRQDLAAFVALQNEITAVYPPQTADEVTACYCARDVRSADLWCVCMRSSPLQRQFSFHTTFILSNHVSTLVSYKNETFVDMVSDFIAAGGPASFFAPVSTCDFCGSLT